METMKSDDCAGCLALLYLLGQCEPIKRWKEFDARGEERIPCFIAVETAKQIAEFFPLPEQENKAEAGPLSTDPESRHETARRWLHHTTPSSTTDSPVAQENKAEAADSGEWVLVPREMSEWFIDLLAREIDDAGCYEPQTIWKKLRAMLATCPPQRATEQVDKEVLRIALQRTGMAEQTEEDIEKELTIAKRALAKIIEAPGGGPGKRIATQALDEIAAAPCPGPARSAGTPIRDAWYCPPGHDSPVRLKFNAFLDEVIAPMERELNEAKRRASHWQERYKEVEELLRIQRDLKLEFERRCAELEKDAGRMDWLRVNLGHFINELPWRDEMPIIPLGKQLDSAIDAALAQESKT